MADVRAMIERHHWRADGYREDQGFYDQRPSSSGKLVGEKSIRADLGNYPGFPFKTNVTVFWAFNGKGELIDVWVWKTVDAL